MSPLHSTLAELNPQQSAAVHHRGSPQIIRALAGSGKTKAISCRFAKLAGIDFVPLEEILAITFTNKAANEMKERIITLLKPEGLLEKKEGGKEPYLFIGTFHGIAARLLREYAQKIGLSRNYTILDTDEEGYIIKKLFKAHNLKKNEELSSSNPLRSYQTFAELYSRCVNECGNPLAELPRMAHAGFKQVCQAIVQGYINEKQENNVLTYDDLLVLWNDLLELPTTREELHAKWSHVIVDEYQDTNLLQEQIISKLNTAELCVVGDVSQSIYGFRSANPENFENFCERYPTAQVFPLEKNYRSTPNILDAANKILEQTTETGRLQAHRTDDGTDVTYATLDDEFAEAHFVAKEVQVALQEGIDAREICILGRTADVSRCLERRLTEIGIPYEKRGGQKISDRSEIRDCLGFTRLLLNPKDTAALFRTLKLYPRIGDATAEKASKTWLTFVSKHMRENPEQPLRSDPDIDAFVNDLLIKSVTGSAAPYIPFELICRFNENPNARLHEFLDCILAEWVRLSANNYDNSTLDERTDKVRQEIEAWKKEKDLEGLLERMSLSKSEEEERFQEEAAQGKKRIILSTIHSAKGLEWSHVHLIGAGSRQLPHPRTQGRPDEEKEEQRLVYVACTRARDRFVVTHPRRVRGLNGKYEDQSASPLIPAEFVRKLT